MSVQLNLSERSTIKSIEMDQRIYGDFPRDVQLGLIPKFSDKGWLGDAIKGALEGRIAWISVSAANELAARIAHQFQCQFTVDVSIRYPAEYHRQHVEQGAGGILKPKEGHTVDEVFAPTTISLLGCTRYRELLHYLVQEKWIEVENPEAINAYVESVGQAVAYSKQLSDSMTSVQRSVLLEACEGPLDILSDAFIAKDPSKRDLVLPWLIQVVQGDSTILQGQEESCLEAAVALQNIYHGCAGLEGALACWGEKIPNLRAQRAVLLECIEAKHNPEFGELVEELSD